jgi:hypothetical protein
MLSNEFLLDNEMLWSSPPPIDLRLLLGDLTANPLPLPIVLDSVDEELLLLVGLGLRRLRRRLVVVGGGGTTSDDEHIIMGRR